MDAPLDQPVDDAVGLGLEDLARVRRRGLEEALSSLGEELHSQYILSYMPNTSEDGGYHTIRIVVDGYNPDWVKHRPGYYWGGIPDAAGY